MIWTKFEVMTDWRYPHIIVVDTMMRRSQSKEIRDWLMVNFGMEGRDWKFAPPVLGFMNDADLMLFMMRWNDSGFQ